jgi:diaminohydroxyphosphoribosylaminopyrimidine deaminase/5-amino-6-(5-phosphoribosylamino)uracil reductase
MLKEPGTTIIATTKPKAPNIELLKKAGAEIMVISPQEDGKVDLYKLLDKLGQRGIVNILAEGGGTLLGSLFDLSLIDKVTAFVSPILIGGDKSPSPIRGSGRVSIASSNKLENLDFIRLDNDILITGYPSSARRINSNGEN